MRPIRNSKLRKGHVNYYDLITKETISRPEKNYVDISLQNEMKDPNYIPLYVSNRPISKQKDRGKPKKTIFTKKQSYSLLPPDGKFPLFRGRFQDRISSTVVTIGKYSQHWQSVLIKERKNTVI